MNTRIPLFSASAANANLDLFGAVKRVIDRHWYVLGEEVAAFEAEFSDYLGLSECVSVANGTDALEIALRTLGIASGDRVVAVANAGFYGSTAIRAIGATPIYADVDPLTLTMSSDALIAALRSEPKAVIVTHLYGQLANIEALLRLASAAGVPVVEDCAQAHGARRHGRHAGAFGTLGCYSFYPTKNLGALGDGGAIVTDDAELASRARALRQYGWSQKYHVSEAGGSNSRLDEVQAAILRLKLPYLDHWNAQRRTIAQRYNKAFDGLPLISPRSTAEDYVAHLYVVRVEQRDSFRRYLECRGVTTDVHYPVPDYRQRAYPMEPFETLTVTETASASVVSLPCYPGMSTEEVDRVIEAVCRYFGK